MTASRIGQSPRAARRTAESKSKSPSAKPARLPKKTARAQLEAPAPKGTNKLLAAAEVAPVVTKQPLLPIDPGVPTRPDEVMVATWSVENLFDTKDDPATDDAQFLPGGKGHYDDAKLAAHLEGISRVIRSMNGGRGPDILALTEVENAAVGDRIRTEGLEGLGYQPLSLVDGPDARGIDTAVLSRYPVIGAPVLHPVTRAEDGKQYRGILEVNLDVGGTPLTVYVNHWYATRAGMTVEKGLSQRMIAAHTLKGLIDEKLTADPGREIVVLGDLNANPGESTIVSPEGLGASTTAEGARRSNALYDTNESLEDLREAGEDVQLGSHFYIPDSSWSSFDHALVSATLLDGKGLAWVPGSTAVVKNDVTADAAGTPRRFFQPDGSINPGGASDHFPVAMRLRKVGVNDRRPEMP